MKPTTPHDIEMIFLMDLQTRLAHLLSAIHFGRNPEPEALGMQAVLNNRIATVTKHRDEKETSTNANQKDI